MAPPASPPRLLNLIAELTYRCPLRCPYCSNPSDFASIRDGLSAENWARVFREASDLGCLHVGLTGGEPSARRDLAAIVEAAAQAGLFAHLVTAGVPLGADGVEALAERGLRSVQLSLQDASEADSDRIAGTRCFAEKIEVARAVKRRGLSLVVNVVLHRENVDRVDAILERAVALDPDRIELAHTQYHGWALTNRDALLPTREQVEAASRALEDFRRRSRAAPEIELVLPDYFRGRPKPCMGGWGAKAAVVTPRGSVLPCHAAETLGELEFWNVTERSLRTCWEDAPGMNAYRGLDWMAEPCRSCPERERDFGGCRCQAAAIAGSASQADPACELSPFHDEIRSRAEGAGRRATPELLYRGGAGVPDRTQ